MELEIFDCEQGSADWHNCRKGIPTASEFDTVLAQGKGGAPSKTRQKYLYTLAGQILTGQVEEGFTNGHTERGHAMEPDARNLYAFMKSLEPTPVGFLRRGHAGASPDSLIGDFGLLEIKTKLPHLQIETILGDRLPPEHVAQCQGQLWISGREWIDFVSYWPGLPLFVKRVQRDEAYIARIKIGIDDFNAELDALVNKLKSYGATA